MQNVSLFESVYEKNPKIAHFTYDILWKGSKYTVERTARDDVTGDK
jgi:hypothetical protein